MKKVLSLLCVILAVGISSAAFASNDPFKTHDGPFGIELKGARLGMTFKSFDEIINFVFDNTDDETKKNTLLRGVYSYVNIIQNNESVGSFSFNKNIDKGITEVSYEGEYFTKNSGSLKESAQMAKWSGDEFMAFVDKNPHLIISIRRQGEFFFLKEDQNRFRLVKYTLDESRFSGKINVVSTLDTKELAIMLMNEYGVEDFTMIQGRAYFVDEANGYCIFIDEHQSVHVFAVADKNTTYPISCDDKIQYYAEKDGKKGIFPNNWGLQDMKFSSVSGWIFEGLRGRVCPVASDNSIFYRDK